MAGSGMPPLDDRRWRSGQLADSSGEVRYVPMRPPVAPAPSSAIDWFRADGEIVLLDDGYPARLSGGTVYVHPMTGRYVLEDLLERFEREPSEELRLAMVRMAHAIVDRAEPAGRSLQMWYEGSNASGLIGGRRHISGLPQAYYAWLLARVAEAAEPRLADAADRFFQPLLMSATAGGVLYEGPPGPSLAMIPMQPRDWILNGWLSMLVAAARYARIRRSSDASALVDANVRTLAGILPAYDAPDQLLSRYMLPGLLFLRLSIAPSVQGVELLDIRIEIPDEVPISMGVHEASGWVPRVLPRDARQGALGEIAPRGPEVRMVGLLSRAPYPDPNRLNFDLRSPRKLRLKLTALMGSYDPMRSATMDRRWVGLGEAEVPAGSISVSLPIPYEPVHLFSYPTNFARRYEGRPQNTYHGTHIVRLRQLADLTGSQAAREWAERWRGYIDQWRDVPAYAGFGCWTPEGGV